MVTISNAQWILKKNTIWIKIIDKYFSVKKNKNLLFVSIIHILHEMIEENGTTHDNTFKILINIHYYNTPEKVWNHERVYLWKYSRKSLRISFGFVRDFC